MLDKASLGERYACFTCGTKFYDLNRPIPTCPECETDQREAPVRDVKSLLSKGRTRRVKIVEEALPLVEEEEEEEANSEDERGLDVLDADNSTSQDEEDDLD